MSDLNPREAALKKINDSLVAAKEAADARIAELEAELAKASRGGRFGRRGPDPRIAELEAENAALRAQLDEPPALLPPHEPETPPPPPPAAFDGRPTLPQLEELAAQSRSDESAVYVGLLRQHAWPDGTIPPQFDDILRDVFGARF